jgi:hypothetical protein
MPGGVTGKAREGLPMSIWLGEGGLSAIFADFGLLVVFYRLLSARRSAGPGR